MKDIQNRLIDITGRMTVHNNRKNRNARYICIGVLFFIILFNSFVKQMGNTLFYDEDYKVIRILSGIKYADYNVIVGIASIALIGIAFLSGGKADRSQRWNFYLMTMFVLFCVLVIMAGISHDIGTGYVLNYAMMLIMLPLLSIVWSDRDHMAEIFDCIAVSIVVFVFIMTLINIIAFPYGQVTNTYFSVQGLRYQGITHNPNRLGEYASIGFGSCLYLIYRQKKLLIRSILAIVAGMCAAQSLLTISRTSMLICIVTAVAWMIYVLRHRDSVKAVIVTIIIALLSSFLTYSFITDFSDPLKIVSVDVKNEMTVSAATGENTNKDSVPKQEEESAVTERFKLKDSMDATFTGRLTVWKMCLNKMTWGGNDISYAYPFRVLNSQGNGYTYYSLMHNVAMELAFRCGIPVGIIFLLLQLWGLVFCAFVLFGKKEKMKDGYLFAIMGICSFVLAGNVEPINEPFIRVWLLMFYIGLVPVFTYRFDLRGKTK